MNNKPKISRSVGMFFLTLLSVFLVYGFQWTSGNPLTDSAIAWDSAQFAMGLMGILLCHEMGHYFVAKKHGFELSVPYFLPFPFAFGTLGAVIHLKSLPKSRTALLEMGAAGPISGFVATIICFLIDASQTKNYIRPHMTGTLDEAQKILHDANMMEPTFFEQLVSSVGLLHPNSTEQLTLMILDDPWILQWIIESTIQEPLSPFAELGPWCFAGWVGCMITSINLLPIGQLDGGHIVNSLLPQHAKRISHILLLVAVCASYFWLGWLVWAGLLYFMGAYQSIDVPQDSALSSRAKLIAVIALGVFFSCVMFRPIYEKDVLLTDIEWQKDTQTDQEIEDRGMKK